MSKETMRDYIKVPISEMTLREASLFCHEQQDCDSCIMSQHKDSNNTGCLLNFPTNWTIPSMSIHDKLIIDFFIKLGAKWMIKPKSTELMIEFWKVHPQNSDTIADKIGTIYYDMMDYTRDAGAFAIDLTKLF